MDNHDPRMMPGLLPPHAVGPLGWFRRFGELLENLDRGLKRLLNHRRWEHNERLREQMQQMLQEHDQRP